MKNYLILIAISLLSMVACIREIEFKAEQEDFDTLVLDGSFTDRNGPHRIYLTHPNKYEVNSYSFVYGAKIVIKDDIGNQELYKVNGDPTHPYFYELPNTSFQGVAGRKYHLEVTLQNGKTYQTEPQEMPTRVKIDSIPVVARVETKVSTVDLVIEQKRATINAALTVPNDGKDYFFRWEAHAVYVFYELRGNSPINLATGTCFVFDNFNEQIIAIQSLTGKNNQNVQVEVGSKDIDKSFHAEQYITMVQRSISKEAYNYWDKVKQIAAPAGNVFDLPPSEIKGNVFNPNDPNEKVLGFFEIAAVDTLRHKIGNRDLGSEFIVGDACFESNVYFTAASECYDCLLLENSTKQIPWYWE
jgi:Domain of unknown function (DUF4249)